MINSGLSPYKKRKISQFVAHEMLYDYLTDQLDSERKRAIEAELDDSQENQKTLSDMKKALAYIEKINKIEVNQEMLEEMNESSNYISSVLKKTQFDKWPAAVKWSIEAMVVLVGVVAFLVVVPWDQALKVTLFPKDKEIVLAEVNRENTNGTVTNLAEVEKKETPQFQDEDKKNSSELTPKAEPTVIALVDKDRNAVQKNQTVATNASSEVAKSTTTESAAKPPKTIAEPKETEAAGQDESEKKTSGYLYRGQLDVTNVEMNSPKITEKIIELGGRKAGEVDIGWKKSDTTYYYHFTLPEAKYDELVGFLSEYAKTELKKEKHPRVMPDGIIRFIITVDEKKQ